MSELKEKTKKNIHDIEYGWCHTDHKEGLEIRTGFREADYMNDEPFASSVKKMLKQMGLPQPRQKQVFRGTHHDLLFLDSHGVVVRIGPTDVTDLIHPAIIQPLGWLDDTENNISVAIYPGIELSTKFENQQYAAESISRLEASLRQSGQRSHDINQGNTGIVRIYKDGQEKALSILLDPDNRFNGTNISSEEGDALKNIRSNAQSSQNNTRRSGVMEDAINGISELVHDMSDWKDVFLLHQPLRTKFWLAQRSTANGSTQDPLYMQQFWNECKFLTEKPKSYIVHKYTEYENENGVMISRYEKKFINGASLYKPWTGKDADQKPKIIIPPHKQKMLDRVKDNPQAVEKIHELFLRNDQFLKQIVKANLESLECLPEDIQRRVDLHLFRLQQDPRFSSTLPIDVLEDKDIQEQLLHSYEEKTIQISDIPKPLYSSSSFIYALIAKRPEQCLEIFSVLPKETIGIILDETLGNRRVTGVWDFLYRQPALFSQLPLVFQESEAFVTRALGCGVPYQDLAEDMRNKDPIIKAAMIAALEDGQYITNNNITKYIPQHKQSVIGEVYKSTEYRKKLLHGLAIERYTYDDIPKSMREDKGFMKIALEEVPNIYNQLPTYLKHDHEIIKQALSGNVDDIMGASLFQAIPSKELEAFKTFLLSDEISYKYIHAMYYDIFKYQKLPDFMQSNETFALKALEKDTDVYQVMPESMKQNENIARFALIEDIERDHNIIRYLPESLRFNRGFLESVALQSPKILQNEAFLKYFNKAEYKRELKDLISVDKWFGNKTLKADFNHHLEQAIDDLAQKEGHRAEIQRDGLTYEWVLNASAAKIQEKDNNVLYNYAGTDSSDLLIYKDAIIINGHYNSGNKVDVFRLKQP